MKRTVSIENEKVKDIIKEIYSNIFCRFKEQNIIVFLCGGASTKQKKSLRDKVRVLLEANTTRYYGQLPFKVFYPEDLLLEMLNKTKEADLLSYEQLMANNSHIIAIICESAGSLVELGAFTNNQYTVDKVIAAVDKRRAKDKSFIMLGPIKHLKKINKLNVVEYSSDEKEFAVKLSKNIREKCLDKKIRKEISLSTIIGMHYYIQLLLYCFKILTSKELVEIIQYTANEKHVEINDFNVVFNAALKLLFKDGKIIKTSTGKYSSYQLNKKGYLSMKQHISDCTNTYLCDKIRVKIMYLDLYKSPRS